MRVDNFRKKAADIIFSSLSRGKNIVIDAPPGIGKTKCAAKAAIRLVNEKDHKVVMVVPTKTLRAQAVKYLQEEDPHVKVHESKGWSDYDCPLLEAPADPLFCSYRKETCEKEGINCEVLKDVELTKKSRLTVATFAKLLLSKSIFSDYSTIIVDESHGFENAETSYLQTYVLFERLREIAEKIGNEKPDVAEKLKRLADGLEYLNEEIGDSVPLTTRDIDLIKDEFSDEYLRNFWLECARDRKHYEYRRLYEDIRSLHFRMQNISGNLFFFYERALYGRPKNMEAEIASFFRDKNVCLLSATIDDVLRHAKACGLDMRRLDIENSGIVKGYPDIRRKNRKLLALADGPNLRRATEEEYENFREKANKLLFEILKEFQVRTLVLFRGYYDQRLAIKYLSNTEISSRIFPIWQGEDPEEIDEKLKKLKENDIVLTSASTRLWEGVDIPGLRLVVIDALPYPGKDPLEKEYMYKTGHETMIKKLKQGLGRIVRSDDDWGAAIIIDGRFKLKFNSIAPKLPWYIDEDFQILPFEVAIRELQEFFEERLR